MQCVWVMLRKCCNHPYLIEFPLNENGELKIDRDLISASGKLLMLNRMLPVLLERGHKVNDICKLYNNDFFRYLYFHK